LLEDDIVKKMMKIILPSIKYCKKIYINRVYATIDMKFIQEEVNKGTINKIGGEFLNNFKFGPFDENGENSLRELKEDNKNFSKLRKKGEGKIPIRILCFKNLNIPELSKFILI